MCVSRRRFLTMLSGTTLGALSGCAGSSLTFEEATQFCETDSKIGQGKTVRVDMHVHLLNIHDIHAGKFVSSRVINADEVAGPGFETIVEGIASLLGKSLEFTAPNLDDERAALDRQLRQNFNELNLPSEYAPIWASDANLCHYASTDKLMKGGFRSNKPTQFSGVFASRIRNAARLMDLFPEVDMFTPAIVDMFEDEGEFEKYVALREEDRRQCSDDGYCHAVSRNVNFYSNLNLATRGRFLPFISFNPARQYVFEKDLGITSRSGGLGRDYFFWIRHAIENLGFIGVKVHPSYGYAPIDNLEFGCHSASRLQSQLGDDELYERFVLYDEYMLELARICKELDVPILTHNGESISLNRRCMEGTPDANLPFTNGLKPKGKIGDLDKGEWRYRFRSRNSSSWELRDESTWTNSPASWLKLMRKADAEYGGRPLRVCLAHFANGFRDPLRKTKQISADRLERSVWLQDAIQAGNKNLFVDVSIVGELVEGKTNRAKTINDRYQELFKQFLGEDSILADNVIYGTDWHMPTVAAIGDRFYSAVGGLAKSVGGEELEAAVMGENAIRFLGLYEGGQNRKRLERFYRTAPDLNNNVRDGSQENQTPSKRTDFTVPLESIRWWRKASGVSPTVA